MIDGVIVVLRLQKTEDVKPQILFGAIPADQTIEALQALCGDKTGIRKTGTRLCVTMPENQTDGPLGSWVVWLFDHVPVVTELPEILKKLKTLSAGFAAPQSTADPEQATLALTLALKQLHGATRRNSSALLQVAANVCVEADLCNNAAVARVQDGKIIRMEMSDQNLRLFSDEMRFLIRSRLTDDPISEVIKRDEFADTDLDPALLAEMAQSDAILLDLPAQAEDGFAFILFAPTKTAAAEIEGIRDLLAAILKPRRRSGLRAKIIRYGMMVAALALVVWLLLPAPLRITATAMSQPAQALSLALPFEVFLEEMHVQIGDQLQAGDLIAEFRSPVLEERREEVALQGEIEKITAQTALAANDYGAFVLAEQRISTNERQLKHIDARLSRLTVTASESGRVISAMGREIIGAFVPPGESIIVLQPKATFKLRLTVGRIDAPLLKPGQRGEVWFRGISAQTWPLVIEAPAMQKQTETGADGDLVFMAKLEGTGQEQLFVGLAGFANIETGQAMRAKVLGRYVIEYVRMKAWTWFDLRF